MKLQFEKSGQVKRRRKSFSTRWNEFLDKIGKHFSMLFVGRLRNAREVRLWIVEWVLLVVVVFLFALVQIFWYSDAYETEAFVAGGDFSEATLGKVNSMNPLYAATSSEKTLAKLLFANLVSPDASGRMKGELARKVEMDETGKIWTVTLRDKLVWADGEPITADDIIYTINLITDTTAKTTVSADFSKVKLEKIDDKSVKFTLPSTYIDFTDSLEFPLVPSHILKDISPALVYESEFSKNPIGSGPFKLNAMQASTVMDSHMQTIYLNRNEKYFLGDTMLSTFTLKTYEKIDDIIDAMKSADVMATAELGAEVFDDMPVSVNRRVSAINGGVFAFLNTEVDHLKNIKVRQAIQMGVNMDAVREGIDEALALNYPILEEQESDLEYPELPKYDIDAAKKLLEEAKYSYDDDGNLLDSENNRVQLTIAVAKRDTITGVAERYVNELKKLGFEAILSIFDETMVAEDFFATVVRPRDFDILIYEIDLGVSADPFVYYSSTQASESGWNFSNYKNGLADDALLSAHTTTDRKLRKTKYESFLKYWKNDVPAIGIYRSTLNYYFARNRRIYEEDIRLTDKLDRFVGVRYWASEQKAVNMTP
jgi:peptide/nickel transport system substrate-binding protein